MIAEGKLFVALGLGFVVILSASQAHAELNLFACEPEWGALASEIGGDNSLHRDDSASGSAPGPGSPGADRSAACS